MEMQPKRVPDELAILGDGAAFLMPLYIGQRYGRSRCISKQGVLLYDEVLAAGGVGFCNEHQAKMKGMAESWVCSSQG
jgi:hypothetical protein